MIRNFDIGYLYHWESIFFLPGSNGELVNWLPRWIWTNWKKYISASFISILNLNNKKPECIRLSAYSPSSSYLPSCAIHLISYGKETNGSNWNEKNELVREKVTSWKGEYVWNKQRSVCLRPNASYTAYFGHNIETLDLSIGFTVDLLAQSTNVEVSYLHNSTSVLLFISNT